MLFFSNSTIVNRDGSKRLGTTYNVFWYRYLYISLFSSTGCHVGHSIWNTLRQSSWMIYGYKWDLVIINLVLTMNSVKALFTAVSLCVRRNRPFWFVTQDKSFYRYSRYAALKCGEFSSTLYWIRGMASNFGEVCTNFFLRKPKFVFMRKDHLYDLNYANWFLTRLCTPGGMLLSSVFYSSFVVKDAFSGFVGCFGLLDSNASSRYCSYVIPSNDDSIDWIVFINDIVSEFILYKKLWSVLKWYYFILKRPLKYAFFDKWMTLSLKKNLVFDKKLFSKKFGKYSLFFFPLWFISSLNNKFSPVISKLVLRLSNFNVKISKNVLRHIFSDVVIKKKLLLFSETVAFYGKPLFFMQDSYTKFLGELNWQMRTPHSFRLVLYNRVITRKRFTSFVRKFQRNLNLAHYIGYINKISALMGFRLRFIYQRFALIFRNRLYSKNHCWENCFIYRRWNVLIMGWFLRLGFRKRLRKTVKPFKFFPSELSFRTFFFFDPLKYEFTNKHLYLYSHFSFSKYFIKTALAKNNRIWGMSGTWFFAFKETQFFV